MSDENASNNLFVDTINSTVQLDGIQKETMNWSNMLTNAASMCNQQSFTNSSSLSKSVYFEDLKVGENKCHSSTECQCFGDFGQTKSLKPLPCSFVSSSENPIGLNPNLSNCKSVSNPNSCVTESIGYVGGAGSGNTNCTNGTRDGGAGFANNSSGIGNAGGSSAIGSMGNSGGGAGGGWGNRRGGSSFSPTGSVLHVSNVSFNFIFIND